MGPLTPGSRMRGGMAGGAAGEASASTVTESVHVNPSSSVTVSAPRCQPVVEYCVETSPVAEVTPSMDQLTEAMGLVPGPRQAIQSTFARPPVEGEATATT